MASVSRPTSGLPISPAAAPPSTVSRILHSDWLMPVLWLTFASSSVVFIEPAPYDILVIALACVLFCLGLKVPPTLGPAVVLLALFTIANFGGALSSGYTADGIRSLAIRAYMPFAWLLFASLIAHDPRRVVRVVWSGWIVAAVIGTCWGIAQYYGFIPAELSERAGPAWRPTGPFKDANVFGPFMVPVALLMIMHLFRARRATLALTIACFLLLAVAILLSFSRGAWLNFTSSFGFLTTLLVIGASTFRRKLNFMFWLTVMTLMGFATLSWIVNDTAAGDLFAQRTALVQAYDVAANGRFATQHETLQAIGRTPFGIGPGMTPELFARESHNIYLQIPLEGGWLAGLSFFSFLLLTIWRGVTRLKTASGDTHVYLLVALAALLGILLQSFFIDSTHWRHFWLLLAMVWGLTANTSVGDEKTR